MQKSFIEKLNEANFGKKGIYIAGITLAVIVFIKLFVTPQVEPYYNNPFWTSFRKIVEYTETVAMINMFGFFISILAFKEKVGHKIVYAMQLKDTTYFKEKWILWWIKSIWVCLGILAVTTIIKQAFFKSWTSFFFLILLFCIPFYLMPRLRRK